LTTPERLLRLFPGTFKAMDVDRDWFRFEGSVMVRDRFAVDADCEVVLIRREGDFG
jgi:hypothetical protein